MYSWLFVCGLVILPGLASAKLTRRMAILMGFGLIVLARAIVGIKCEVIDVVPGRGGKIPPRCIIAAKHMSILEIAVLMTRFQNAFFIIKKELSYAPAYGWAFRRMGFVPVDRRRGATNMADLTARVSAQIEKGRTLVIFPEGTRKKPGDGVKLKGGLFHIAAALRLPIQPVGTNTGLFWPKRGRMRGGVAKIWLEEPLPHDAPVADVAAAIGRHSV